MANILDSIDVIKNIESMYESNTAFNVLKDFERVLDELDLYVYKNWEDGELAAGPEIERHWVSAKFFWPADRMPDPMGGKRLLDYDCKVFYEKSYIIKPRPVMDQDDFRPGTKKGKLDRHPIWIVEIRMPKKLLSDMYGTAIDEFEVEDAGQENANQTGVAQETPPEAQDQSAPAGELGL